MIILDATTKTLEVVLAGIITTNQLPVVVSYVDEDATTHQLSSLGESDTATNSATPVTVLAAPASNHTRTVKSLTIFNSDTATATVTLRYNNNGTIRIITTIIMSVGDTLEYEG